MISKKSALIRALSPALIAKAILTFDRLTLLIVSICWATTIAVIIFTLFTINLSVSAQKAAEEALATEPTLPKINHSSVGGKELQTMIDRLQRRYPDISIAWQNNVLTVAAPNGGLYHQWLTAIGQIDTLYPQFHWAIKGFCVGKDCGGQSLMSVDLVGEKISFEMPQVGEKN